MCLRILRLIRHALNEPEVAKVEAYVNMAVGSELQNRMRRNLVKLEETSQRQIFVHCDEHLREEEVQFVLSDSKGNRLNSKDLPMRPTL